MRKMVKRSAHIVGNLASMKMSSNAFNKYFLLSITLFLSLIFICNFISANSSNNYLIGNDITPNSNWMNAKTITYYSGDKYPSINISEYYGFGNTLLLAKLLNNTDKCGIYCESIFQVHISKAITIISNIEFYEFDKYGNNFLTNTTPSYNVYIKLAYESDSEYVPYNLNTKVIPGDYIIKLNATKERNKMYDWVITSNNVKFYEWAIWGNISAGAEAETLPIFPTNGYVYNNRSVQFKCFANITTAATLTNISLMLNSTGYFEINQTHSVTGSENTSIFNVTLNYGTNYLWTCRACDTDGSCGLSVINYTLSLPSSGILTESVAYNATSYETKRESFSLNVSWNNDTFPYINATFYYNNTRYYPINSIGSINQTVFRVNFDIPLKDTPANNTFFWTINVTDRDRNSYYFNSSFYNQTVNTTYFARCNSTLGRTYLNVSFYDELTLARINETFILSTNFSIGTTTPSTVQKTFYFDSSPEMNYSYSFCYNVPSENVVLNSVNVRYAAVAATPSYAERSSIISVYPLLNITNNLTLYSLSTPGIYVTLTIQDTTGTVLQDVQATMTTLIGGTTMFTVGSDLTDTSGQVVFFVNPLSDHTLYLNKTGCVSRAIAIRPTASTYTFQLDCGNAGVPLIAPYIGASEGVLFRTSPPTGPIYGSSEYALRVTSSRYNIAAIRMELIGINLTQYAAITKTADNVTCYPQDCFVNMSFDPVPYELSKFKGRYLVNLTLPNGTGSWYVLEADAYWTVYINTSINGSNMKAFWKDFRAVFDEWNEYDGSLDEANRAEFSRIIFIFLIMALLIACFNKFTGYDSANPGAFLGILASIFLLGSLAGGRGGCVPGFFYLSGLFGADHYPTGACNNLIFFMNNYIVSISVLMIFLTYILNVQRRNS